MKPKVYMLCGLTGSGKTTYALKQMPNIQRLSIDETVFNLHGEYGVDYPHDKYFEYMDEAKAILDRKLINSLANRESLVLDYGFWTLKERNIYKVLIDKYEGEWELYYFKADKNLLTKRLIKRNERKDANALYVTTSMLNDFLARFEEPVNENETVVAEE